MDVYDHMRKLGFIFKPKEIECIVKTHEWEYRADQSVLGEYDDRITSEHHVWECSRCRNIYIRIKKTQEAGKITITHDDFIQTCQKNLMEAAIS